MDTIVAKERVKVKTNETLGKIYERRAIRKYKDKLVDKSLIEMILDAGRMAPSALNKQPWKFYVLTNKKMINDFSKEIGKVAATKFLKSGVENIVKTATSAIRLSHGADFFKFEDPIFHGAPVVIFITSPTDNKWAALDVGMCSQNMMLAAKSFGLDTCPVGLGIYVEQTKIFSKLKVPDSERVFISIILGYGDESPKIHKREKNNVKFVD
jgi:nitroreductase